MIFLLPFHSENCQHAVKEPFAERAAEILGDVHSPGETSHLLPALGGGSHQGNLVGSVQSVSQRGDGGCLAFLRAHALAIVGQFHQDCGRRSSELEVALEMLRAYFGLEPKA